MAGATFQYKIQTEADLRAFKNVESSLQRQIALAVSAGKDVSKLQQQLARTQQTLAQAPASLPKAPGGGDHGGGHGAAELLNEIPGGGAIKSALAAVGGGAAAATFAGIGAAIGLATEALVAFAEKEKAVADLDQVLSNTGQLTDEYREKLQGLADSMEDATNIADDQWLAALTKLTQAGADAQNIDALTEATKNFSAITGGDAVSSAESIGRALKGNFMAFQRMGIQIDKTATQTQKMDSLMQQLAQRGGGILENRTKTLSGEFATLKTQTGNFTEGLGNLINRGDGANRILAGLSTAIKFYSDLLPQTIAKTTEYGNKIPVLTATTEELDQATKDATEEAKKFTQANTESAAALDKEIQAIDKKRQRLDSQTDASTALKIAQIDLAEASGLKSGSQAGVERAQVRAVADREKIARELLAITDRENALITASDADLKSIQETETERARLNFIISEEMAKQESIIKTKKFERTVGGDDPKIQEALNAEFIASRKRALPAETALPGVSSLLEQKNKAFDLETLKRTQQAEDDKSRRAVLGFEGQTVGAKLKMDVGKSKAEAGGEDIKKQATNAALDARRILEGQKDRGAFDASGPMSVTEAINQAVSGGKEMNSETIRLAKLTAEIYAENTAISKKQQADLEALRAGQKTLLAAPSSRP